MMPLAKTQAAAQRHGRNRSGASRRRKFTADCPPTSSNPLHHPLDLVHVRVEHALDSTVSAAWLEANGRFMRIG